MAQHRSEGATRPRVSPTAWLTSWVGLGDSGTATSSPPTWGPRRLDVGSDAAPCEWVTRCVQHHCSWAKRKWLHRHMNVLFSLQDQWNQHRESIKPGAHHHKFFDGCQRVYLFSFQWSVATLSETVASSLADVNASNLATILNIVKKCQ